MQISKDLSGFSGSQADTLRKGIAKKDPAVLAKMKKQFIDGAVKHSKADRGLMERFWNQLEDFAAYCFNKSHAACYGLIAYQTAYLKANYPDAFMAALMTSDYDNIDRLAIEISECKNIGLKVLQPDINQSFHEFAIVPGKNRIRFGLDAIKNVGHGAVDEILRAREKAGGKFDSLEDFCRNVNCHVVNRKALESLVKTGAFDGFGDRGVLFNNLENILSFATKTQKEAATGQVDLFGGDVSNLMTAKLVLDESMAAHAPNEQLVWERELMGLYLSHHPLQDYEAFLTENTHSINDINETMDGVKVRLGGTITDIREITTRSGERMAFIKLADMLGEIELVLFPKIYKQHIEVWQRDKVIVASGKLGGGRGARADSSELKLLVDEAKALTPEDIAGYKPSGKKKTMPNGHARLDTERRQRLYIRVEDSANQPVLMALKEKLDGYKGETEVVLVTGPKDSKQAIKLPQTIDVNEESLRDLASVFGAINVVVK
jgi:DNA polymerase III subunit alpha